MTQALPRTGCAEAAPFPARPPDIPDQLWEDPSLDPIDVWLYGWLTRWSRLHPGWWPNQAQIAKAMRRSSQTVGRCRERLRSAGWIAAGPNLVLTVPSARLAPAPDLSSQGMLPGFACPDESTDRHGTDCATGGTVRSTAAESAPPHTPPSIRDTERQTDNSREKNQVSPTVSHSSGDQIQGEPEEQSLVDDTCKFFWNATPEKVRREILEHGRLAVKRALEICQRRKSRPDSFGYLRAILTNFRIEGIPEPKPLPAPKPRAATAERRFVPDAPWDDAKREEWFRLTGLRCPRVAAQEKTAAGPPSKSARQAVGDRSRTLSNYTVNECSRQNQTGASPDQLPQ
jgi:hypothetical protein